METRKMKLALSAGALALSLALAGCGGGGSPQSPTQAELDAQEAMKRAEMQMTAIMEAIKAAEMAVAAIDTANPTEAQVNDAASAVEAADMAVEAAVDVDDTSSYAATVMTLDNFVKVAQTAVTTGVSLAEAEKAKAAEEAARAAEEAARKAAEQANTLFRQANDAETAAMKAGEMATKALATAKSMAGMLDVISVAGNSMTAMDYAQAILDAKDDVDKAHADAEKAKMDAEAAQTAANALPADTPELASLITEAKEAVDAAKGAIAAIEAIQKASGSGTLAAYVYAVEKNDGNPTKIGEGIAKMIGEAFATLLDGDGGTNDRVMHSTGTDAPAKAMPIKNEIGNTNPVMKSDASDMAMTWAEIVEAGGDTVADKAFKDLNVDVAVTSVAGMAVTKFTVGTGATPDALDLGGDHTLAPGGSLANVNHMGIGGTLYCVDASTCTVEDGKLKGKVYFGADDVKQLYTKAPDEDDYSDYDLYATYGYWLSQAAGDVTVRTFAGQSHDRAAVTQHGKVDASNRESGTPLPDGTATYKGQAIGMSMMKSFDGTTGKEMGHKSGEFEAMVTLTAEFNATPKLSGTINGFSGVGADPSWSVTLQETSLGTTTGSLDTTGIAQGSGTTDRAVAGTWSAQTYGEADKRPTGIFGGFNAHFDNGHAAGAYATRK